MLNLDSSIKMFRIRHGFQKQGAISVKKNVVIAMILPEFSLLARDSTIGFHHPVPAEVKRKRKGVDLLRAPTA